MHTAAHTHRHADHTPTARRIADALPFVLIQVFAFAMCVAILATVASRTHPQRDEAAQAATAKLGQQAAKTVHSDRTGRVVRTEE